MASSINASTSGAGGVITTADNTGILNIQTASTTAVTVDASQNVGIGTSTPGYSLHVQKGAGAAAYIGAAGNGNSLTTNGMIIGQDSSGLSRWYQFGANPLTMFTNNIERMRIDSNGRILKPYQPAFAIYDLSFPSGTAGVGTGGTVVSNVGSCYNSSNGRFTAPVSGTYLFNLSVQAFNSGSTTYINVSVQVNGSSTVGNFVTGYGGTHNNHTQITGSVIAYLSANDYAQIRTEYGARDTAQNTFNGFLIG
jgi:hypothetical protein